MTAALDDTITRDLAALAAENRRAWRSADAALAALEAPRPAPPVSLGELATAFAGRAAWLATIGVGAALAALYVATTAAGQRDPACAFDWLVLPMLASYPLARHAATRWFVARAADAGWARARAAGRAGALDDAPLLPARQALARRAAWLGASLGALDGLAVVIDLQRDAEGARALQSGLVRIAPAIAYPLFHLLASGALVIALAIVGHVLGARLGERAYARLIRRTAPADRPGALQRLLDQLAPWTTVAIIAAVASAAVAYAMFELVVGDTSPFVTRDEAVAERSMRLVLLAIGLIVVVAIALGRAWRGRVRGVLGHPIALVAGTMIAGLTVRAASRAELSVAHWTTSDAPHTAGDLPVLRAAVTLGVAAAAFLIASWIALARGRRCARDDRGDSAGSWFAG
jgi:hypothetical protein